ncbi:hypothetical protein [Enterobacter roggenkampii]|uniref:hypothetical protein n=1 Tax=Enterobacter roggenkampii TaxID=1812935 RepID=UPI0003BF5B59|nr:hypothetical protein [Enterobacter roggenkampii]ESL75994.1 hypothetical protein L423_03675 [Enterobacter roggenkampii]MBQ0300593.1 hypothetical protein [Enterobacter roggenkampii]HCU0591962.1 hypothetical protein [Enterobacter roggenkampii]
MSKRYEDLIKNARMNAECGEHMSPEEITTLLNVVEATFAALASESAGLKDLARSWANATDDRLFEEHGEIFHDSIDACEEELKTICPATDAFLAEVRAAAVDEVCLKISNAIVNCYQDEMVGLDEAATICGDFAAQLRKGVQA